MKLKSTIFISLFALIFTGLSSAQGISQNGKVAEVINVKSYTYLRLEEPSTWVATMPTSVQVGDEIQFQGGMSMGDFYSKTLDRTFASVVFVQTVDIIGKNASDIQTHKDNIKETTSTVSSPSAEDIPALKNGQTIANIYAQSTSLKTQQVKLRARVMKVNKQIMGKNWITLRDGTGSTPNDKLLATSSELVSPGDLVIVSGVLQTNVDLGSGYTYKVLLEQASFVKEDD